MASRRAGGRYYNSTDGDTSDEANLVMNDNEPTTGRRKKYIVSDSGEDGPSCNPRTFSRNEWICVVVGVVSVLTIIVVFIAVGVSVGTEVRSSSRSSEDPWKNIRLPKSLTPEEYNIHLTVDLSSFTVEGSSVSTINVTKETDYIIIHAKNMTILSQHVSRSGETLAIKSNFSYTENDFYILSMKKTLSLGTIELDMTFTYELGDTLVGFYKSSYVDDDGDTHWLASTQFEPTDARRAFPCFDEPALKANFSIMLTHNSSLNAHSNMPVESVTETRDVGMSTTKFWPSVKMSTYLVAFVVSDFVCVTNATASVNVSVCSNPDVIQHTAYALEKAADILLFYEKYYNIPFPLPKEDLFAIPDFAAGAMENWGLITYRETAILYNPEEDPEISKQRVAVVIAHELAHQWFGNLVTMEWWDGLWLNEGFATYTEYVGTNHTEPSFDMLEQFFLSDVAVAFSIDGLNETHPIVQTVSDPDEINELFDTISYSKGGSVIRMIKNFLGADKFRDGITFYLNAHRFGNAETSELWDALQTQVSNVNVSAIMNTWTLQMGYPVLHVDTVSGKVSQERFFYLAPNGTIAPSPYNYVWMVPFNYLTENEHSSEFIMNTTMIVSDKTTTIRFPSSPGFIKVNYEQTGFYRVNYDLQNWNALIQHLHDNPDSEVLSPGDRAGLINDAFALSSAGMLDVRIALNLSRYVKDEREFVPLSMGLSSLGTVGNILSLTATYGIYQEFLRNITSDLVQEYGFNRTGLSHLEIFLRTAVLSSAWFHGNTEVIDTAKELFRAWRKENKTVDANLKSVVFPVGIASGTEGDWDFVWQQYLSSSDPHEKRLYLGALAHSRAPWILNRYLQYSISDEVRTQDSLSVVTAVARNIYGRHLAWNFVRENWDHLNEVYGGGSFSFSRLILSVTSGFTTELELKEVETFFEQQSDLGSGARAVRQAIETIKLNIKWLDTNTDLIYNCLSNQTSCFAA